MSIHVSDILRQKGKQVVATEGRSTVFEAIKKMVDNNVGSIMVVDNDNVRGIFTERDYLRRIVLQGRTSKTTRVEEVMSSDLVCVDPSFNIQECLALMTSKKCRHLPVIETGKLIGVVSIGDCVKKISDVAQTRVRYLEDFVTGKYPA